MIDAVLCGLAMGLGSVAYMTIQDGTQLSYVIATICFSIIMMAIPFYKLDLFLGRPGVLSDSNNNTIESILIYMGNFVGVTWIGLLVKAFPIHNGKVSDYAHFTLKHLHEQTLGSLVLVSMFAGMMYYAGVIAINKGMPMLYFFITNLVCTFAHWPIFPLVFFCLWADSWAHYWYLFIPITIGNVIGANIWIVLRRHSPTYKNEQFIKPDSYDIVDRFRDFVYNNQTQNDNKDNHSDT